MPILCRRAHEFDKFFDLSLEEERRATCRLLRGCFLTSKPYLTRSIAGMLVYLAVGPAYRVKKLYIASLVAA